MTTSMKTCIKLHEALVGKKGAFDVVKITEELVNYIKTIVNVAEDLTKNRGFVRKRCYFETVLKRSIYIKKTVEPLMELIDKQIVSLKDAIDRCQKEEERLAEEKKKIDEEKAKELEKILSTNRQSLRR